MKTIELLFGVWAYLPIFSLTDDLGFLTAIPGSNQHKYYLSLINILFGEKKYQLISVPIKQQGNRVELFRIKQLSKIDSFQLSEEKVKDLEKKYKEHYDSLDEQARDIEKEALLQHLSMQQSRMDISYNKINAFTTIILAIIPIAITFVNREMLVTSDIFEKIILVLLIYATVNLCAWIFQAINVRGYMSSSFKDLKESEDKPKEWNWQIYYNWQHAKRKADMFVSFVKYTKCWIIAVIILTTFFSIGLPNNNQEILYTNDNQAYTLQLDLVEKTYDKSAVEWYNILARLQTNEYTKILILYNEANTTEILKKLEQYEQQEIIMIFDDTLSKNEIKIVLEN